MKKFLTLVFVSLAIYGFSQKVSQQKTTMSLGPQHAYYIEVEGADKDMLEDLWEDYVKEFGKVKNNKKAKEVVSENVKVALINGASPLTLYARHEEGKGVAGTYLWVDLGGSFASSDNASQSAGIESFLTDFWIIARKKAIGEELKAEEKRLNGFNKEMSKLLDKNKDYHEEIDKCKMKIAEAEKNIVTNLNDQKTKQADIDMQKKMVQAVTDKLNAVGKN